MDVLAVLNAMAAALTRRSPFGMELIGPAIGLRFESVTAVGRSDAALAIVGGTLVDDDTPIQGVVYKTPPRRISIFFPGKMVSDTEIAKRVFAPEQQIVPSSAGGGYAIVFNVGDVECAVRRPIRGAHRRPYRQRNAPSRRCASELDRLSSFG